MKIHQVSLSTVIRESVLNSLYKALFKESGEKLGKKLKLDKLTQKFDSFKFVFIQHEGKPFLFPISCIIGTTAEQKKLIRNSNENYGRVISSLKSLETSSLPELEELDLKETSLEKFRQFFLTDSEYAKGLDMSDSSDFIKNIDELVNDVDILNESINNLSVEKNKKGKIDLIAYDKDKVSISRWIRLAEAEFARMNVDDDRIKINSILKGLPVDQAVAIQLGLSDLEESEQNNFEQCKKLLKIQLRLLPSVALQKAKSLKIEPGKTITATYNEVLNFYSEGMPLEDTNFLKKTAFHTTVEKLPNSLKFSESFRTLDQSKSVTEKLNLLDLLWASTPKTTEINKIAAYSRSKPNYNNTRRFQAQNPQRFPNNPQNRPYRPPFTRRPNFRPNFRQNFRPNFRPNFTRNPPSYQSQTQNYSNKNNFTNKKINSKIKCLKCQGRGHFANACATP